jgi:hypothetical protein
VAFCGRLTGVSEYDSHAGQLQAQGLIDNPAIRSIACRQRQDKVGASGGGLCRRPDPAAAAPTRLLRQTRLRTANS